MKRNVTTVVALTGLAMLLAAAPGTAKDPKRQDDLDIRAYLSAFGTPSSDASTEPTSPSTTIAKAQIQGLGIEFGRGPGSQTTLSSEQYFQTTEHNGSLLAKVVLKNAREEVFTTSPGSGAVDRLGKRAKMTYNCQAGGQVVNMTAKDKRGRVLVDGQQFDGFEFQFPSATWVVPFGGRCTWTLEMVKGPLPRGDYLIFLGLRDEGK